MMSLLLTLWGLLFQGPPMPAVGNQVHGGSTHTFTHVSNACTSANVTTPPSSTCTLASNPTTGNAVVVFCATYNNGSNTPPTVLITDGATPPNSYTVVGVNAGGFSPTNYNGFVFMGYLLSAPSNANNVITCSYSSPNGGFSGALADEFSYTGGGSATFCNSATATSTTANPTTPTIPVCGSSDLLYEGITSPSLTPFVASPWTANSNGIILASWNAGWLVNASSTTNGAWTFSAGNAATIGISIQ